MLKFKRFAIGIIALAVACALGYGYLSLQSNKSTTNHLYSAPVDKISKTTQKTHQSNKAAHKAVPEMRQQENHLAPIPAPKGQVGAPEPSVEVVSAGETRKTVTSKIEFRVSEITRTEKEIVTATSALATAQSTLKAGRKRLSKLRIRIAADIKIRTTATAESASADVAYTKAKNHWKSTDALAILARGRYRRSRAQLRELLAELKNRVGITLREQKYAEDLEEQERKFEVARLRRLIKRARSDLRQAKRAVIETESAWKTKFLALNDDKSNELKAQIDAIRAANPNVDIDASSDAWGNLSDADKDKASADQRTISAKRAEISGLQQARQDMKDQYADDMRVAKNNVIKIEKRLADLLARLKEWEQIFARWEAAKISWGNSVKIESEVRISTTKQTVVVGTDEASYKKAVAARISAKAAKDSALVNKKQARERLTAARLAVVEDEVEIAAAESNVTEYTIQRNIRRKTLKTLRRKLKWHKRTLKWLRRHLQIVILVTDLTEENTTLKEWIQEGVRTKSELTEAWKRGWHIAQIEDAINNITEYRKIVTKRVTKARKHRKVFITRRNALWTKKSAGASITNLYTIGKTRITRLGALITELTESLTAAEAKLEIEKQRIITYKKIVKGVENEIRWTEGIWKKYWTLYKKYRKQAAKKTPYDILRLIRIRNEVRHWAHRLHRKIGRRRESADAFRKLAREKNLLWKGLRALLKTLNQNLTRLDTLSIKWEDEKRPSLYLTTVENVDEAKALLVKDIQTELTTETTIITSETTIVTSISTQLTLDLKFEIQRLYEIETEIITQITQFTSSYTESETRAKSLRLRMVGLKNKYWKKYTEELAHSLTALHGLKKRIVELKSTVTEKINEANRLLDSDINKAIVELKVFSKHHRSVSLALVEVLKVDNSLDIALLQNIVSRAETHVTNAKRTWTHAHKFQTTLTRRAKGVKTTTTRTLIAKLNRNVNRVDILWKFAQAERKLAKANLKSGVYRLRRDIRSEIKIIKASWKERKATLKKFHTKLSKRRRRWWFNLTKVRSWVKRSKKFRSTIESNINEYVAHQSKLVYRGSTWTGKQLTHAYTYLDKWINKYRTLIQVSDTFVKRTTDDLEWATKRYAEWESTLADTNTEVSRDSKQYASHLSKLKIIRKRVYTSWGFDISRWTEVVTETTSFETEVTTWATELTTRITKLSKRIKREEDEKLTAKLHILSAYGLKYVKLITVIHQLVKWSQHQLNKYIKLQAAIDLLRKDIRSETVELKRISTRWTATWTKVRKLYKKHPRTWRRRVHTLFKKIHKFEDFLLRIRTTYRKHKAIRKTLIVRRKKLLIRRFTTVWAVYVVEWNRFIKVRRQIRKWWKLHKDWKFIPGIIISDIDVESEEWRTWVKVDYELSVLVSKHSKELGHIITGVTKITHSLSTKTKLNKKRCAAIRIGHRKYKALIKAHKKRYNKLRRRIRRHNARKPRRWRKRRAHKTVVRTTTSAPEVSATSTTTTESSTTTKKITITKTVTKKSKTTKRTKKWRSKHWTVWTQHKLVWNRLNRKWLKLRGYWIICKSRAAQDSLIEEWSTRIEKRITIIKKWKATRKTIITKGWKCKRITARYNSDHNTYKRHRKWLKRTTRRLKKRGIWSSKRITKQFTRVRRHIKTIWRITQATQTQARTACKERIVIIIPITPKPKPQKKPKQPKKPKATEVVINKITEIVEEKPKPKPKPQKKPKQPKKPKATEVIIKKITEIIQEEEKPKPKPQKKPKQPKKPKVTESTITKIIKIIQQEEKPKPKPQKKPKQPKKPKVTESTITKIIKIIQQEEKPKPKPQKKPKQPKKPKVTESTITKITEIVEEKPKPKQKPKPTKIVDIEIVAPKPPAPVIPKPKPVAAEACTTTTTITPVDITETIKPLPKATEVESGSFIRLNDNLIAASTTYCEDGIWLNSHSRRLNKDLLGSAKRSRKYSLGGFCNIVAKRGYVNHGFYPKTNGGESWTKYCLRQMRQCFNQMLDNFLGERTEVVRTHVTKLVKKHVTRCVSATPATGCK